MRTVQQRTDHFTARMQSTLIDPVLTAVNAQQQANYQAYITEFYPYQEELRNWLNTEGKTPLEVFKFEALNGECYRAWRNFAGPAAVLEFTAIHSKWVDFGLDTADVKAVMLAVWSIIVP
jgi:hypothetical protein